MQATNKVVRGTANWTQSNIIFEMSTSAFTRVFLYDNGGRAILQHMACNNNGIVEDLDITLDDAVSFGG